jgi:vacuolar-type H+-ATPase subunit H
MKNFILLSISFLFMISLTSCWEFNRTQKLKDAENDGKAILAEAESSKKALIETAKAENEAASLQAEAKVKIAKAEAMAEIERARGVAEANRIIGESLKGNEVYLKYLWVIGLQSESNDRIYIPTEAGMPILEAKK